MEVMVKEVEKTKLPWWIPILISVGVVTAVYRFAKKSVLL